MEAMLAESWRFGVALKRRAAAQRNRGFPPIMLSNSAREASPPVLRKGGKLQTRAVQVWVTVYIRIKPTILGAG